MILTHPEFPRTRIGRDDQAELAKLGVVIEKNWFNLAQKSKNAVREALPEFNRKNSENASAYIVTTVVLNRSGFDKDGTAVTEIGNGWGYYDLGLNNMALLLKATELGISTLVMGIRDGEKLRKEFDIPKTEAVVSVIAVGYTDSEIVRPKRKSVEDFAKFYED